VTEAEFVVRLFAGLVLGLVIGLERQWRHRPAGLRTNALVCIGATLFVALSIGMEDDTSPTRVASQIVTGVGFLGAGVIIREGLSLRGIDTAATLWVAAAIGSLAGAGLLLMAAGGTAAVLFVNVVIRLLARRIEWSPHASGYQIRCSFEPSEEPRIRAELLRAFEQRLHLRALTSRNDADGGTTELCADVLADGTDSSPVEEVVSNLSRDPAVTAVRWEPVAG
jgi:putative Mg2+ transporter-C (MgtC) family protein